jgi:hypothetical protein
MYQTRLLPIRRESASTEGKMNFIEYTFRNILPTQILAIVNYKRPSQGKPLHTGHVKKQQRRQR